MSEEGKKRGFIEKLIMGAIIGGAVGSVIGLTIAPKKGKETRKDLKEKGQKLHEQFMEEHGEDLEKITGAAKKQSKKFFGTLGKKVTGLLEKRKEVLHHSENEVDAWELPDESDM